MEWTAIRALPDEQLNALDALARRAAAIDGVPPKLYWPLLGRSDPGVLHLMGHDGGALLAVASSFCFEEGDVEFTCLVDPSTRLQGRSREALFRLGQLRAQRDGDIRARLRMPDHLDAVADRLSRAGAHSVEGEHTMMASTDAVFALDVPDRRLTLRIATYEDAGLLAAIDASSFGTMPARTRSRFQANVGEVNRRVWIAERDGIPVGKLHARRDRDGIWIHDLCIEPQFRRLGLGHEMVLRCTRQLLDGALEDADSHIWLEVHTDNDAAITAYTRCGFKVARTDTMLELPLPSLLSCLKTTSADQ